MAAQGALQGLTMLPLLPLFCIPVWQYFVVPVLVLPSISGWVAIPGDRSAAAQVTDAMMAAAYIQCAGEKALYR